MKAIVSLLILHIHFHSYIITAQAPDQSTPKPVSSFRDILGRSTFIDKTLMVKNFFELCAEHRYILFTCPRGLGKSTNLDMLREFVQIEVDGSGKPKNKQDSSNYHLFTNTSLNLHISQHKDVIDKHLGAYPTIYLDLSTVIGETFEETITSMKQALRRCLQRHASLYEHLNGMYISPGDLTVMKNVLDETANDDDWQNSIVVLTRILFQYFGKKIFFIIDNYDAPVIEAIFKEPVKPGKVFKFMTKLLKSFDIDSHYVEYALISGITSLCKTDENNLTQQSYIKDNFLCGDFGLTVTELDDLLHRYKFDEQEQNRIKQHYRGYVNEPTSTQIYHTNSIMKTLLDGTKAKTELITYWEEDGIIRNQINLLKCVQFREYIIQLIFYAQGQVMYRPRALVLSEIKELRELYTEGMYDTTTGEDVSRLFTYLFKAGYLSSHPVDQNMLDIIPNEEIRYIFAQGLQKFYLDEQVNLRYIGEKLHALLNKMNTDDAKSNLIASFDNDFALFKKEDDHLCTNRDYCFEFKAIILSAARLHCSVESAACHVTPGVIEPGDPQARADVIVINNDKTHALVIKVVYGDIPYAVYYAKEYRLKEVANLKYIVYMGVNVNADFKSRVEVTGAQIGRHARVRREIRVNALLRNQRPAGDGPIPTLNEITGDLFQTNDSLAHCVGKDFLMSAGIATQFKKRFGGVDELLLQNKTVGEVAVLKRDGRSIFYLITKRYSVDLPNMESFTKAVTALTEICIEENIAKLAMPRIGCGLDQLKWNQVKQLIQQKICRAGIEVDVYRL